MKIAILGAGSIGCFIGGAWAANGADVTFIGRPRIAEEVAAHGLRLSDYSGWTADVPHPRFETDPAALAGASIVVLTVKSTGTEAAGADIARHAKADAAIVSFQNGVSNADRLRALLPGRTVLAGMAPYIMSRISGPGAGTRARRAISSPKAATPARRSGPRRVRARRPSPFRTTCRASSGASCSSISTMR